MKKTLFIIFILLCMSLIFCQTPKDLIITKTLEEYIDSKFNVFAEKLDYFKTVLNEKLSDSNKNLEKLTEKTVANKFTVVITTLAVVGVASGIFIAILFKTVGEVKSFKYEVKYLQETVDKHITK